jgi:acetyltransferase-like isoleucine patch superfamily enzyme
MDKYEPRIARSHGTGEFRPEQFASLGRGVIFEAGVLVFHPETITIGDNVYVGHNSMLKGYHRNTMVIGRDTWIGQAASCTARAGSPSATR